MYSVKPVFFSPLYFCVMHCSSTQDVCIKLTWWEKTETRFESLLICSTVQQIAFQKLPKGNLGGLACGLAEVVQPQSGTVWYWLLDHTPPSHVHSFCPLSFVLVSPAWTPLKSCPRWRRPSAFPERLSFRFGFRGEVVAETSPWHIVRHWTHSSALFFSSLSGTFKCCYLIIFLKGVLL